MIWGPRFAQLPETPLSALQAQSDGKGKPIQSVPAQLQELPERCCSASPTAYRGSKPEFLSGFTPLDHEVSSFVVSYDMLSGQNSQFLSQTNHGMRQVVLGYILPVEEGTATPRTGQEGTHICETLPDAPHLWKVPVPPT